MIKQRIKLCVMDVDGTLTDGKIYMSNAGEMFKAFNIKDGYAINEILPQYDIIPVIITGRESAITKNRADELNIVELYQGKHNKLETLRKVTKKYHCNKENVAYIGDDILDIECMKECGIIGCPADAIEEVKAISDYISKYNGGEGAVRDFIEWIIKGKYTAKD